MKNYFRQWVAGSCLGILPINCVIVWLCGLTTCFQLLRCCCQPQGQNLSHKSILKAYP